MTSGAGVNGARRHDPTLLPPLQWNRLAACDIWACTAQAQLQTAHQACTARSQCIAAQQASLSLHFTCCTAGVSPAASERAAPSAAGRTTAHSTDARDSRAEAARAPQLRAWMPSLGAAGRSVKQRSAQLDLNN